MRNRPLSFACLFFLLIQMMILLLTSRNASVEIPASSIFSKTQEKLITVQGQVYKKSNTSNLQILYLKNNSVFDSNLLIYNQTPVEVCIGETIKVQGRATTFDRARNPGNFDQALYYARQDIYGVIWCDKVKEISGKEHVFAEFLYGIKMIWKQALIKHMGEENGPILAAMLLGEKSEMDAEVKELYQKTGIGHLLAISGLHISFIGMGLYKLLRRGGLGYLLAGILSLMTVSIYVFMLGFSVSVIRAYIMLILRIGADMAGRHYDMVTAWILSAAVVIGIEPLYLTDAGFWLSYGAIFGILFVLPALGKCFFGASLAVNIALFPILLWFYFEFPVYSIFLNMLVVPLMGLLLGLGMLGSFFLLCARPLAQICFYVCDLILHLYELVARIGCELPLARVVFGKPKVWMILLYYGVLFLLIVVKGKRMRKVFLWVVLIFTGCLMGIHPGGNLQVTVLDVGQGDGIFLRGPKGQTYFIDGGSSDVDQVGKYRIEPFLKSQGVGTLDYVFLSHGDADHCNGMIEMLERKSVGVRIQNLVLPMGYEKDETLQNIAELAYENDVKVFVIKPQEKLLEGDLTITCLHPKEGDSLDGNATSMVLDIEYGEFSFLSTGDAEKEGETLLQKRMQGKSYDVLKVAHHGSMYSTTEEFLEIVNPKIAIISAGKDNLYGHPHYETLVRLKKIGCRLYETEKNGAITLITDGNSLTISLLPFKL